MLFDHDEKELGQGGTLLFWPMTTMMTLLRATPAKQQQHHDACSKSSPTHGQPPPWWCQTPPKPPSAASPTQPFMAALQHGCLYRGGIALIHVLAIPPEEHQAAQPSRNIRFNSWDLLYQDNLRQAQVVRHLQMLRP
eukprot:scaffold1835_cov95-Skeletonema_dohrnii-CCMP3373.AAC.3